MRARNLKPGFFKNEELASVEPLGRILFEGLWCLADRSGRLEDRPLRIKAEILPYDNCDVDALLSILNDRGFIKRYEVNNNKYIEILKFLEHQHPHWQEKESSIPSLDSILDKTKRKPRAILDKTKCNPSSFLNPSLLNPSISDFESFWSIYPARNGKKLYKKETQEYFLNLKAEVVPVILQATKNYAESELIQKGIGIKDPIRFLRKEVWKEWSEPETKTIQPDDAYSHLEVIHHGKSD